jgi:hypothetical protein
MQPNSKFKHDPLLNRLNELFKDNPEKSTIVLKEKCSECGLDITIEITPTSEGFGLMGGALLLSSTDKCIAKCLACYEKHFKIDDDKKSGQ